jgi:ligand-binding sensor domain-containing protein
VKEASRLLNNECHSLYETRDGGIWAGTARGVARMTSVTGSPVVFEYYDYPAGLLSSPGPNNVIQICEDRRGLLWLTTFWGLLFLIQRRRPTDLFGMIPPA